nr:unnamed protein product [Spirometra erinaceieuropaei]
MCLLKDLRISIPSVAPILSSNTLCGLLVGDFHPWGNLKTILSSYSTLEFSTTVSSSRSGTVEYNNRIILTCLRAITDISSGLSFLHFDLAGTRGRPAIAHRSLSLDCVYVKADGVCCIADLEYAICPAPHPLPPPDYLAAAYLEHCRQYAPGEFQARQPVHRSTTAAAHSCELSVATSLHQQRADRPPCSLSTQSTTVVGTVEADRSTPKPSPSHSGGSDGQIDGGESGVEIEHCLRESSAGDSLEGKQGTQGGSEVLLRALLATPNYPDWWPVFGLQVGHPQYMAPELLTLSMNPFDFEAHKRADIYALGTIIWDLLVWGKRSLSFCDAAHQPTASGLAGKVSLKSADLSTHGHRHWAPLARRSERAAAGDWAPHSGVSKVIVSEPHLTEESPRRASLELSDNCCSESRPQPVSLSTKGLFIQPTVSLMETGTPDPCGPPRRGLSDQWPSAPLTPHRTSTEPLATYSLPLAGSSAQTTPTDQPISRLLQRLSLVIAECRHPRPELRLSALRVKKTLLRLMSEFFPQEKEEENEVQNFEESL